MVFICWPRNPLPLLQKRALPFQRINCFEDVEQSTARSPLRYCWNGTHRLVIVTLEERPSGHQHADSMQESKEGHARKELDAIFLVLDCIIDLGLSDRGLSQHK